MEQEVGPELYFPARSKTTLTMLSRSNLMVLARTEGFDPTGATNGELRDFITQKTSEAGSSSYIAQRLSTNHVLWYLAAAKVEAADQSTSLLCLC